MSKQPEWPPPAETLWAAYRAFSAVVATIDDELSWLPTGCIGWSIHDLIFHCLCDAQRGLVALHTPVDRAANRDAVSYWQDWRPDDVGGERSPLYPCGREHVVRVDQLRHLYLGQQQR